jgi:hypothetical protein
VCSSDLRENQGTKWLELNSLGITTVKQAFHFLSRNFFQEYMELRFGGVVIYYFRNNHYQVFKYGRWGHEYLPPV